LAGRRRDALEETAGLVQSGKSLVVPTDVTEPDQVANLFAQTKGKYGRVDMLFNNAGGNVPATNFGDFTFEMWTKVVAVNLNAMFLCANAAFRIMRDQQPQGGRIINNGSISAHAPRPGSVAYTSTKHAVTGLTKTISLDGRQYDIACGQVDIGNAATPMTDRMTRGVPQANGATMVEPRMDVDHVGAQVLFMANLPLESNVQFVTIMATKMPFVGRG
jgi:NAD(P)-dependent dehydrogenase (short-subunit alcohol dehydrogenase family)